MKRSTPLTVMVWRNSDVSVAYDVYALGVNNRLTHGGHFGCVVHTRYTGVRV